MGAILARTEAAGFRVTAARLIHMTKAEAEGFYHVHRERPFFGGLTDFMSSGPCLVMCLEAEDVAVENVAAALHRLLDDPAFRRAAAGLRDAIAAMPDAARVIGDLTSQAPASAS